MQHGAGACVPLDMRNLMTPRCPSDDQLAAFTAGALEGNELADVEQHVDGCVECRQLVAAVSNGSAPPASPGPVLQAGDTLGRYEIEKLIGAGGMGVLYVARDPKLARRVALKLLRPAYGIEDGHQRLLREAQAMAGLAHPNVVSVFDIGEANERIFMSMELLEGGTLREWTQRPRGWRQVLKMFCAAGEGLAAAHAAGVVHRDFKPENVIIGRDGRPRVGDFGLARPDASVRRSGSKASLSRLTQTGMVLGTPAYMPPEQLLGHPADHRTDQYAFCVSLWEALVAHQPYPVGDEARAGGPAVPAHVWAALARGLNPRPAERFPDMRALLDALVAEGSVVSARQRVSRMALVAASALVLVGLGAGVGRWSGGAVASTTTPTPAATPRPTPSVPAEVPREDEDERPRRSGLPMPSVAVLPEPVEPDVTPLPPLSLPARVSEKWREVSVAPSSPKGWPANAEVHVVGGYEGPEEGKPIAVKVDRPGADVVLVLVSYSQVSWAITSTPQTRLRAILSSTSEGPAELTAPRGVSVRRLSLPYAYDVGKLRGLQLALRSFGVGHLASFTGAYALPATVSISTLSEDLLDVDAVPTPLAPPVVHLNLFDATAGRWGSTTLKPELLPTLRGLGHYGGTFTVSREDRFDFSDGLVRIEQLGRGPRTRWLEGLNVSWPQGMAFDSRRNEVMFATSGGEGGLYRVDARTGRWNSTQSLKHLDLQSLAYDPVDDQLYGVSVERRVVSLASSGDVASTMAVLPMADQLLGENDHHQEQELTVLPAEEGLLILGFPRPTDEEREGGADLMGGAGHGNLTGIWFVPRGSRQPQLIWRAPLAAP